MKQILKYVFTYIMLILAFISILVLTGLIPKRVIEENVRKSLEQLELEGFVREMGIIKIMALDNFTDALMMDVSYTIDENNPLSSVMEDNYSCDVKRGVNAGPIVNLRETLENNSTTNYKYYRYWHGYLAYLRPLLCFFNYNGIRIIFTIILCGLAIRLLYLLCKKEDKFIALILLISLFMFSYQYCGMSLTYFPVLCISMISSIYIVKKRKINFMIFFIIGGLVSFFDLLTTPLLALGLPLVIYLIVNKEETTFKDMLIIAINWVLGYALIWISKWIIGEIILHENIINNAIENLIKRTGSVNGTRKIYLLETVIENTRRIEYEFIFTIFLTIFALIIKKVENVKISKKEIFQFLIIAILPILWYATTKNHSIIHAKFTYRNMLLTIFSLLVLDYKIFRKSLQKECKEEKEK